MTAADQADQPAPVDTPERPGPIDAVPVRHPGRWVAIGVIAVLVAMFVHMLVTNDRFNWPFVAEAAIQTPVLRGLLIGTLTATVGAMVIGVVLGVILAVMRLSPNPVLRGASWTFTWFFRATPRLVLLTLIGSLALLYSRFEFGVPFDFVLTDALGLESSWRVWGFDANDVLTGIVGGIIGLGLSEAAYMAEIARAGILSVDTGQAEAAKALGMTPTTTMRRIVLPQAMRVIVPPTGNETISMLKDTSLLIGIPVNAELFFQLQVIGSRTFQVFPVLVTAICFYLALSSVLMVGQSFLERRYGRGFGATGPRVRAAGIPEQPLPPISGSVS